MEEELARLIIEANTSHRELTEAKTVFKTAEDDVNHKAKIVRQKREAINVLVDKMIQL